MRNNGGIQWYHVTNNCFKNPPHFRKGYANIAVNNRASVNPFQNKPWFLRVCSTRLLKTLWEKETFARNEQFLLFPQCFLTFKRTFHHFYQTQNCRLQRLLIWKNLKFVVWEKVNTGHRNDACSNKSLMVLCHKLRLVNLRTYGNHNSILSDV